MEGERGWKEEEDPVMIQRRLGGGRPRHLITV